MSEKTILEKTYRFAKKLNANAVPDSVRKDIDLIVKKIENNKSLVSAVTTSLIKKISCPQQDVRLHRKDFAHGYSARVLDTKVTTPFFKSKFPKYANKESAFLTLATRERVKWTKEEGQALKIRNRELKNSFLNIFERIETGKIDPKLCLEYLLFQLINLSRTDAVLFKKMELKVSNKKILNINLVINMLSEHFGCRLSSRLPVIAIYSIYEILLNRFERYKDKQLISLHVHTSSDKHSFGDIEIYTKMSIPFEIVEIKHNIPIDKYLVFDIARKTENTNIDRYYILTTFRDIFRNKSEEEEVFENILHFRRLRNIDIIANGIISTLRYYLRFVDDYSDFLKIYTKNLVIDAKNSTEVKDFHLSKWREIREKYM